MAGPFKVGDWVRVREGQGKPGHGFNAGDVFQVAYMDSDRRFLGLKRSCGKQHDSEHHKRGVCGGWMPERFELAAPPEQEIRVGDFVKLKPEEEKNVRCCLSVGTSYLVVESFPRHDGKILLRLLEPSGEEIATAWLASHFDRVADPTIPTPLPEPEPVPEPERPMFADGCRYCGSHIEIPLYLAGALVGYECYWCEQVWEHAA